MSRTYFLFILITLLMAFENAFCKVVLIDPGHGGEELGAVGVIKKGQKIFEKDLSLRLAKKIKEELAKSTSVYLTRSFDRLVSLQERSELADLVKADLLLSIHFNSSPNVKIHGFEMYYLDNNSNVATRKVEKSENVNLKGEELIVNQILVDLVIQQTVTHSTQLARKVHQKVKGVLGAHKVDDRGVKPGLFFVLAHSKRPGILIEAGFISNEKELQKMNQEKYLSDLAAAIAEGVVDYIKNK